MTLYQTLSEASLVFCILQDDRLHAAADEFPDRPRPYRRDPDGDAFSSAGAQAGGGLAGAAGALRVFAARELSVLSAGIPVSGVGSGAGNARWHHRARRVDRTRSL